MKNHVLSFILFLPVFFSATFSSAQCTIDSSQTTVGLYPDTMPPATANHFYTQDVTAVFITDTLGLTIQSMQLIDITGGPPGLNWICNNFATNCVYDPQLSLYGCVNISGTPILAGTYYPIVHATVTVSILGTLNYDIVMPPFVVLPDTSSNAGFSTTNPLGCQPLTVAFTNNNPSQISYFWDFGNGTTSTLENPPPVTYTDSGSFVVSQTITVDTNVNYFLSEVLVSTIPDNYGGVLDPPDMYFIISDSAGNTVYNSQPSISNTQPPYTWDSLFIALSNQTYSLHVWDEDAIGADDDLGVITFPGTGPSGTATATVSGASGQLTVDYTIFSIGPILLNYSDTIEVLDTPEPPMITITGNLVFCDGDSVLLTASQSAGLQWHESAMTLGGDTSQTYAATQSGNYFVVYTSANGCSATSDSVAVTTHPLPPKPSITISGTDTLTGNIAGFAIQWYLNNIAISGATGITHVATQTGFYFHTVTDSNGCVNYSDTVQVISVGYENTERMNDFTLFPNPANERIMLSLHSSFNSLSELNIMDAAGRIVLTKMLCIKTGNNSLQFSVKELNAGIYSVILQTEKTITRKNLVIY
jgi:PKD repeat protein